jgi:hypothetical protein
MQKWIDCAKAFGAGAVEAGALRVQNPPSFIESLKS